MSPSKTYQSQDVEADIRYWQPWAGGSIPNKAETIRIMNGLTEVDAHKVTIHDIRNVENDFTLAENGLQVWNLPSEPECTKDEDGAIIKYYPEVVAYLKNM